MSADREAKADIKTRFESQPAVSASGRDRNRKRIERETVGVMRGRCDEMGKVERHYVDCLAQLTCPSANKEDERH